MVKAVIFDLNGVFVQSPKFSDLFSEKFGVPAEVLWPVMKEIMVKVRLPAAGDAFKYWRPHLEKWGVKLSKEEFFDFCFESEKEAPEMTVLARELKERGIKIFILSNNFAERAAYYDKNFPVLREIAENIYYSWQTGFVKPDPEAYKKVLADNGLSADECLYFDDSEENIKSASALGIWSYLFESAEAARKIIEQSNQQT